MGEPNRAERFDTRAHVVADVHAPRSVEDVVRGLRILRRESRGTREVMFLGLPTGSEDATVVVKFTGEGGDDPQSLFELHEALWRGSARDCVPRGVAWGTDPNFFAYEFVRGEPLKRRIERLASGTRFHDGLTEVSLRAGDLLARFHDSIAVPADATAIDGPVLTWSRRLAPTRRGDRRRVVRSLGDSGAHNLLIDDDGQMQMIDLDARERWTYAESDIGVLAHRLARRAANAQGLARPSRSLRRVVFQAVLGGYREFASFVPDEQECMLAFGSSSLVFGARTARPGGRDSSVRQAIRDVSWWTSALAGVTAAAGTRAERSPTESIEHLPAPPQP